METTIAVYNMMADMVQQVLDKMVSESGNKYLQEGQYSLRQLYKLRTANNGMRGRMRLESDTEFCKEFCRVSLLVLPIRKEWKELEIKVGTFSSVFYYGCLLEYGMKFEHLLPSKHRRKVVMDEKYDEIVKAA